jgi:pSer/pThr/pTyr-binding forkhead associated (FHA) protein
MAGQLREVVQGEELALGRSDFESIVPGDRHRYISRTHLEIRATQTGAIQLRDADSSNGTSLDGQDISDGEYWTLSDGTPVELDNGSFRMTVSLE